jgi:hypothetical protein
MTVRGEAIVGAVGSAVVGCTRGVSTTLTATGASATVGASAAVACSVATGAGV